jgi:hypothetical protein
MIKLTFLLIVFTFVCGCSKAPSVSTSDKLSPEEIFNSNSEAVVLIRVYDKDGNLVSFGSGVNIHPEGKIITNLHVLGSDCFAYDIKFEKHGVYEEAYVTGISPILEDYIILNVDGKNLPSVSLSPRTEYETGENVFTIGNPKGLLNSLSDGLISGKRVYGALEYYQMTASISHGSSGGAVLDEHGLLIGISTAILEEGQNLNFFLPMHRIVNAEILDTGLTITQFNSLRKKRAMEYKEVADRLLLTKDYEQAITNYELSLKYYDSYAGAKNIRILIEYYVSGGDLAQYEPIRGESNLRGGKLEQGDVMDLDQYAYNEKQGNNAIELVKKTQTTMSKHKCTTEEFLEQAIRRTSMFPVGWKAIDVSDSTFAVVFVYTHDDIKRGVWLYHVILKDQIVKKIELNPTESFVAYLDNLRNATTYPNGVYTTKLNTLRMMLLGEKWLNETKEIPGYKTTSAQIKENDEELAIKRKKEAEMREDRLLHQRLQRYYQNN